MKTLAFMLALVAGWPQLVTAAEPNCAEILAPPAIPRVVQDRYAIEVDGPRGDLAPRLDRLDDGVYLFLITADKQVIVAPKFEVDNFLKTGKGLVTHKSLLAKLESQGQVSGIAGAGEFVVTNGRVNFISNRSGNFRAGESHFQFSQRVLIAHGLPLEARTIRHLIDPSAVEDLGHTPEAMTLNEFILSSKAQLRRDNPLLDTVYLELHAILARAWPDAIPGEVDVTRFYTLTVDPLIAAGRFEDMDDFTDVWYALKARRLVDGHEQALNKLSNPRAFYKVISFLIPRVGNAYRAELAQLKRKAAGL